MENIERQVQFANHIVNYRQRNYNESKDSNKVVHFQISNMFMMVEIEYLFVKNELNEVQGKTLGLRPILRQ